MKALLAAIAIAFGALVTASPALAEPINEDSSSWDCRVMGNQICGPVNSQGVQAGQYANGTLIPWPHGSAPEWCRDICLGA